MVGSVVDVDGVGTWVVAASKLSDALKRLCIRTNGGVALGVVAALVTEISPTGSAWMLYNSLQQHGYVHVFDLVQWFYLLQQANHLDRFFESTFDGVKRVFQQGERHRFRIAITCSNQKIFHVCEPSLVQCDSSPC